MPMAPISSPRAIGGREPALLLLRAVIDQVVGADAMYALSKAGDAASCGFFVQHGFMAKIPAGAAILGGYVGAQQPHRAGLAPYFLAHVLLFAPLRLIRHHFRIDETRNRVAKDRKILIHPWRLVGLGQKTLLKRLMS